MGIIALVREMCRIGTSFSLRHPYHNGLCANEVSGGITPMLRRAAHSLAIQRPIQAAIQAKTSHCDIPEKVAHMGVL